MKQGRQKTPAAEDIVKKAFPCAATTSEACWQLVTYILVHSVLEFLQKHKVVRVVKHKALDHDHSTPRRKLQVYSKIAHLQKFY